MSGLLFKKKGKRRKKEKKTLPLILTWWKKVNLLQLLFNLDRWTLKQEPVLNKSHAREKGREREKKRERDPVEVCLCLTLGSKVSANRFQLPQCPN